jgi:[protein-PII] uridylyltransferase
VTLVDDASETATVVEVRAHDAPGLLWRVGRALGECGLDVRAARVETLGAEVVDVFYVTDADGKKLDDADLRRVTVQAVLAALGNLGPGCVVLAVAPAPAARTGPEGPCSLDRF